MQLWFEDNRSPERTEMMMRTGNKPGRVWACSPLRANEFRMQTIKNPDINGMLISNRYCFLTCIIILCQVAVYVANQAGSKSDLSFPESRSPISSFDTPSRKSTLIIKSSDVPGPPVSSLAIRD